MKTVNTVRSGGLLHRRVAQVVQTGYTITKEPLEHVDMYWAEHARTLQWDCLFMLPPWVRVWHRHFGSELTPHLYCVYCGTRVVGIAAVGVRGTEAYLLGSPDLCDYLDCIIAAGHERAFFELLFAQITEHGVARLVCGHVREDSAVVRFGVPVARQQGLKVISVHDSTTFACVLPETWEAYLLLLTGKQRHEARRKLHKFTAAGSAAYRAVEDGAAVESMLPFFIRFFRESRSDKAAFMTSQKESFFCDLARELARHRLLHLGVLELNGKPVAMVFCCDYEGTRFLYNSGFDPHYRDLSPGLVCKLLSIKDALKRGFHHYDFLKGAETYKRHLGGIPIAVYQCSIELR